MIDFLTYEISHFKINVINLTFASQIKIYERHNSLPKMPIRIHL